MKIAILGGGLAGLELGRNLKEIGKDFIILEKEPQIGGLCRTNIKEKYRWDFGVHAMYSRAKEIADYFHSLPIDYEYLNRNVKIFHSGDDKKNYMLDYPFETGIKNLPLNHRLECVKYYVLSKLTHKKKHPNLKDWIDSNLGKGISKYFMIPFNSKMWNCDLSRISKNLVNSRIEPPSLINFLLSVFGKKIIGRAYQSRFIYPKEGIQKFIDYIAKDIQDNIILNAEIERLVNYNKRWIVIARNGKKEEVDIVISTMPLVELIKKIKINGIEKEYDVFKWNDTFFVMIGLKEGFDFKQIRDCHWVFFKENELFYRVSLMHNLSKALPPTLVAEITCKANILNKSDEEIKDLVIKGLLALKIIDSPNQIAETDIKLLKYTYPIPTVGLDNIKNRIKKILKIHNIFLLGRSGNWEYINMDEVIANARKFVARILADEKNRF